MEPPAIGDSRTMRMDKWFPDVTPEDRVIDVAARAVADRLDAVRRYLKRCAKAGGEKDIHQLRVWSRRADAALALYADLLPSKQFQWFRTWLKRSRRAAGRVRDCDVFVRWVNESNGEWPVRLRCERRRGLKKIRALWKRLDSGRRFKRRAQKLVERMAANHGDNQLRYADFARAQLTPLVAAFFAAAPTAASDDEALHEFRIRGKELRYVMELLAGAFPIAFREELYPRIMALQEQLGRINDLTTADSRLGELIAHTGNPATLSRLQHRRNEAGEERVHARTAFLQSWSPEHREDLSRQFATLLQSPE